MDGFILSHVLPQNSMQNSVTCLLLEELDHTQSHYQAELQHPNGMSRYGMVLNQLGLERWQP